MEGQQALKKNGLKYLNRVYHSWTNSRHQLTVVPIILETSFIYFYFILLYLISASTLLLNSSLIATSSNPSKYLCQFNSFGLSGLSGVWVCSETKCQVLLPVSGKVLWSLAIQCHWNPPCGETKRLSRPGATPGGWPKNEQWKWDLI